MTAPFRPAQLRALRTLSELWQDRPYALVGAAALRCQLDLRWRTTEDLDVTLAVTVDEYPGGLDRMPGWKRHPRYEHEWHGPDGVFVDLLPAGPELLRAGHVIWPVSGFRMSLVGFRHAFEQARPFVVETGLTLPITPMHVIALLKMSAYQDRPMERERDLADLGYILDEYLDPVDERRYSDDLVSAGVDFEEQGAYASARISGRCSMRPNEGSSVASSTSSRPTDGPRRRAWSTRGRGDGGGSRSHSFGFWQRSSGGSTRHPNATDAQGCAPLSDPPSPVLLPARRRRGRRLAPRQMHEALVLVAPGPVLSRLEGASDRVAFFRRVL